MARLLGYAEVFYLIDNPPDMSYANRYIYAAISLIQYSNRIIKNYSEYKLKIEEQCRLRVGEDMDWKTVHVLGSLK